MIKRVRGWLTQKRWLIRMAATYLLTSVVLTSLLVIFISRVVTTRIINQTDASNRELLSQVNLTLDYTLADLYSEFVHLWRKDSFIQTVLNASGELNALTPELDQLLTDRLSTAVSQASLVHSAFLISHSYDRVWSSAGAPTSVDQMIDPTAAGFIAERLNSSPLLANDIFFGRQAALVSSAKTTRSDVLSFLFVHRDTGGQPSEILLVNLDRLALEKLIQKHEDSGVIALVSPSGAVLAQTSHPVALTDLSRMIIHPETVQKILQPDGTNGSIIAQTVLGQSLVTWQKADQMNLFLIDVVPLSGLNREADTINRLIGSYFLITLLVSLLTGLLAVRYLYKPIQNLVQTFGKSGSQTRKQQLDEFSSLETAYMHYESQAKDHLLAELLAGKVTPEAENLYDPSKRCWIAVSLMPAQTSSYWPAAIDPLLETIRTTLNCPVILRADDQIVALPGFSEEEAVTDDLHFSRFRNDLKLLLATVEQLFQIEWVAGIGSPVIRLSEARTTLRQAIVAANQAQLSQQSLHSDVKSVQTGATILTYAELGLGNPVKSTESVPAQAVNFIRDHLDDSNLNADAVAREIGISSGYLRQLFKQELNKTLNEYLIDERITKACQLLKETELTAKEIAAAIGILDSRYFYTVFKKKTGQTTEAFRQNSQRKDV